VCLFVPRCHGRCGSLKETFTSVATATVAAERRPPANRRPAAEALLRKRRVVGIAARLDVGDEVEDLLELERAEKAHRHR
jgi:hypothetical protein